jgi:hypothetical protein
MANKSKGFKTPSWSSPKGGTRGCLCADSTYSSKCCDGSLQAQGIGNIYGIRSIETFFILQENSDRILQENNYKILLENG